jgi:hypothetical protein
MSDETQIKVDDDEIIATLTPDIARARNIQSELDIQRESYYKGFRGALYGNERAGWAHTVAPVIYTAHQSNLASLAEIFSDEFFTLKSDTADRATNFQKLIRYQMFRKQDGYKRLYDFLHAAGLFHYAVIKCYYREDFDLSTESYDRLTSDQMLQLLQDASRTVTKYKEIPDELGGTSYEKVKIAKKDITYAGPCFEVVPPWEFFYSEDCKITDWGGIDGRLVYHEVKRTLDDVRKRERAGIYRKGTYDKCVELAGAPGVATTITERSVRYDTDGLSEQLTNDTDIELAKELRIQECYCKLDIDNDGLLEPCTVVIIEDKVVAQAEENPYKRPPFRVGSMLPEPFKVHGIAPPSILENDQKIQTNLIRFAQDMAAQICYRNVITSDQRMAQMLQNRKPFDVIIGDPAKIGEVPVQRADPFILKTIELTKGEVEEGTGNSRYNQGMDSESLNKTATGISLISQASAKRLRMAAKALGNGPITGIIRDFIFINQKWKSQDPIRLLGTDIQINPEDLDGEYDIEIDIGVSSGEKQQVANQLDLLVQFGTQAGMQMGIMKPIHILKAQKKKFSMLNINVDDLLVTEQQFLAQQQQQQQMMQQQQGGMPGPPGGGPPPPPPPPQQPQPGQVQ